MSSQGWIEQQAGVGATDSPVLSAARQRITPQTPFRHGSSACRAAGCPARYLQSDSNLVTGLLCEGEPNYVVPRRRDCACQSVRIPSLSSQLLPCRGNSAGLWTPSCILASSKLFSDIFASFRAASRGVWFTWALAGHASCSQGVHTLAPRSACGAHRPGREPVRGSLTPPPSEKVKRECLRSPGLAVALASDRAAGRLGTMAARSLCSRQAGLAQRAGRRHLSMQEGGRARAGRRTERPARQLVDARMRYLNGARVSR